MKPEFLTQEEVISAPVPIAEYQAAFQRNHDRIMVQGYACLSSYWQDRTVLVMRSRSVIHHRWQSLLR